MADNDDKFRISPSYALGQLARALSATGEFASRRVAQWSQVIAGMFDGTLSVGSRTPVANTPPWVTLEVVHGGFATGNFAASGPLLPHELAMLESISTSRDAEARSPRATTERAQLNLHYVSDAGRSELSARLADGRFRIQVPEEAALLIVTWLVEHGEVARSEKLVEAILPFFDRLRFYPAPHERPLLVGSDVSLQTVGASVASLRAVRPKRSVLAMKEAIGVWAPLYDRAAAVFLETVEGDPPRLRTDPAGTLLRRPDGNPIVDGGWPCRHYADGWSARARSLLDEYAAARINHPTCGKPERRKENFALLRGYLARCVEDPARLTGRDVGMIRKVLASYVTRHGVPSTDRHGATRAKERTAVHAPLHAAIAEIVARRLETFPQDEANRDVEACLGPITASEAHLLTQSDGRSVAGRDRALSASEGAVVPEVLAAKAMRCLQAPIETLVERRLIRSSESMARTVPLLTAGIRAAAIDDAALRRVFAGVYQAFRARRSLLLLNLENQVKLNELPWIAAIEPWVGADAESRGAAREALVRTTTLAVRAFPQTILPNKLIKELRALAAAAGETLPLTDELAADIFMGAFSETFLRAAQAAGRLLRGSLYERYYGVPYERVLRLDDIRKERFGAATSPGFAAICTERVPPVEGKGSFVAQNGAIIEQAQIITTHNLAVLFDGLGLSHSLKDELPALARACFGWICRRLQLRIPVWRTQLQTVKNAAYAWRQLVFFLSLMDQPQLTEFLTWSAEHLTRQSEEFQRRFQPVAVGLAEVAGGQQFGSEGELRHGTGRRFLGWSVGRHWLLPERLTVAKGS